MELQSQNHTFFSFLIYIYGVVLLHNSTDMFVILSRPPTHWVTCVYIMLGCPFKHWDEQHLRQMLVAYGLSHKGITQVISYAKEHHHQLACQKYFEITHGVCCISLTLEYCNSSLLKVLSVTLPNQVTTIWCCHVPLYVGNLRDSCLAPR